MAIGKAQRPDQEPGGVKVTHIDWTKGSADPLFADIIILMGARYAWQAVADACERELNKGGHSPQRQTQLQIGFINARGQLKLLEEEQ